MDKVRVFQNPGKRLFKILAKDCSNSPEKSWHGSDPPPFLAMPGFWKCLLLVGGGGGATFRKNLLDFGGSKPLPGLFGPLFSDMKCPRVPFECGAGGAIAIWAMPKYLRGRELSVDNFG